MAELAPGARVIVTVPQCHPCEAVVDYIGRHSGTGTVLCVAVRYDGQPGGTPSFYARPEAVALCEENPR